MGPGRDWYLCRVMHRAIVLLLVLLSVGEASGLLDQWAGCCSDPPACGGALTADGASPDCAACPWCHGSTTGPGDPTPAIAELRPTARSAWNPVAMPDTVRPSPPRQPPRPRAG